MNDSHDSVRRKVAVIFDELTGDRAEMLKGNVSPARIASAITTALLIAGDTETESLRKDQMAFHLTDWNADAAFLVALHLFPERFTPEEVRAAIDMFMWHVPNHIVAAAKLGGYPIDDTPFDAQ